MGGVVPGASTPAFFGVLFVEMVFHVVEYVGVRGVAMRFVDVGVEVGDELRIALAVAFGARFVGEPSEPSIVAEAVAAAARRGGGEVRCGDGQGGVSTRPDRIYTKSLSGVIGKSVEAFGAEAGVCERPLVVTGHRDGLRAARPA